MLIKKTEEPIVSQVFGSTSLATAAQIALAEIGLAVKSMGLKAAAPQSLTSSGKVAAKCRRSAVALHNPCMPENSPVAFIKIIHGFLGQDVAAEAATEPTNTSCIDRASLDWEGDIARFGFTFLWAATVEDGCNG